MDEWEGEWEAAEAQWVVDGAIVGLDLPGIATEALTSGWDSPSLRVLAASATDDVRDLGELALSAASELGRPLPDRENAKHRLVLFYASRIASGRMNPTHRHLGTERP